MGEFNVTFKIAISNRSSPSTCHERIRDYCKRNLRVINTPYNRQIVLTPIGSISIGEKNSINKKQGLRHVGRIDWDQIIGYLWTKIEGFASPQSTATFVSASSHIPARMLPDEAALHSAWRVARTEMIELSTAGVASSVLPKVMSASQSPVGETSAAETQGSASKERDANSARSRLHHSLPSASTICPVTGY